MLGMRKYFYRKLQNWKPLYSVEKFVNADQGSKCKITIVLWLKHVNFQIRLQLEFKDSAGVTQIFFWIAKFTRGEINQLKACILHQKHCQGRLIKTKKSGKVLNL